ncbi:MAG: hypothetical protein LBS82_00710 [Spirochaetaceae bacterium]|jgi:hypothetical protein|nr:hypothetical protein [Spirochaetaceae bacterium]
MAARCKSFKKAAVCVAVSLGLTASLGAEAETREFLRFIPFLMRDVDDDEGNLIEFLIRSYIPAIVGLPIFTEPPDDDFHPRYTVSGGVSVENGNHILSVNVEKSGEGTAVRKTAQYKNTGEMALNLRSILEECFYEEPEPPSPEEPLPIGAADIVGVWEGEKGVEMVRFFPEGTAIAYFSSGAIMRLSYAVENKTLNIVQESPNEYRHDPPLPEETAKGLAEVAPPIRWRMFLYQRGRVLRGASFASYPEAAEEAAWTKTSP